ncbi:hypothetical protein UlMin_043836 [Ulmus minor]
MRSHSLLFLFFMFFFLCEVLCDSGGWPLQKVHVKITNHLNVDLTLHCQSRNNDLGAQVLSYNQFFAFHFRVNFWGSTQFCCSFQWENELHWFDVFGPNVFCKNCDYSVKRYGPCLYNDTNKAYDDCYGWNNPVHVGLL